MPDRACLTVLLASLDVVVSQCVLKLTGVGDELHPEWFIFDTFGFHRRD